MKRSEMVEIIFGKLMMLYNTNLNTMQISDELLKEIEKVGMLPPERNIDPKGLFFYGENTWEPEDEA